MILKYLLAKASVLVLHYSWSFGNLHGEPRDIQKRCIPSRHGTTKLTAASIHQLLRGLSWGGQSGVRRFREKLRGCPLAAPRKPAPRTAVPYLRSPQPRSRLAGRGCYWPPAACYPCRRVVPEPPFPTLPARDRPKLRQAVKKAVRLSNVHRTVAFPYSFLPLSLSEKHHHIPLSILHFL